MKSAKKTILADAPLAPGLSFAMADAGFAPDTRVLARDLYAGATVGGGWTVGKFTTLAPIAAHDTLLLRLTFVPRLDL